MKTCVFGGTTDDLIDDNNLTITTGLSSRTGGICSRSSISATAVANSSRFSTTPKKKLSNEILIKKQKRSGEFPYKKRSIPIFNQQQQQQQLNNEGEKDNNNKILNSLDRLSHPSFTSPLIPLNSPQPSIGTCRYQRTQQAKCSTVVNPSSLAAETNSLLLPPSTPVCHKHVRRTSRVINNVS
jgi:hypothetical protein